MRLLLLVLLMMSGVPAMAQMGMYLQGGAYFGQAGCGGNVKIPREIKDIEKDQKKIAKKLREAERKLKEWERKEERAEREFERYRDGISKSFKSAPEENFAAAIVEHLQTDYIGATPSANCVAGEDGVKTYVAKEGTSANAPWKKFCDENVKGTNKEFSPTANRWGSYALEPGSVSSEICRDTSFLASTYEVKAGTSNRTTSDVAKITGSSITTNISSDTCISSVSNYRKAWQDHEQAKANVAELTAYIEQLEEADEILAENKEDEIDAWRDDMAYGGTEGRYCITCGTYGYTREVSTTDKVLGLVGSLANAGAAYYGTKMVMDNNRDMGWPTSPWMAYGMAYPYVMAGIYGAGLGGGGGAYGCGGYGGMGGGYGGGFGGGAFGYPAGMYGGMGGGMYGPGMGAYMGMPGFIAAGIGAAVGIPYGGFPAGGGYGIPYGGFPAAGGFPIAAGIGAAIGIPYGGFPAGGGGYGIPYGGFPAAGGFPIAAGIGAAIGIPYGGFPAGGGGYGIPYGGFPAAGGFPIAAGIGAAIGMPYGGFPAMGAYGMPYGGMGGGIGMAIMPYGGMPQMGMPMGIPYSGMPMGGSMAAMQYQQQLLMQQQQQMQIWMQEQQRMQQDYMQRTQLVGRLQQELYRIQMQIQQISVGGYSSGGVGGYGFSSGGGSLIPTGNIYDPYGSGNYDPNLGRGRGGGGL